MAKNYHENLSIKRRREHPVLAMNWPFLREGCLWRHADLPSAPSSIDRLPLHSCWIAGRHVVRRSIMDFRRLRAAQAMPDRVGRSSSAAGRERCITWDQSSLAPPFHDRYCRRIPDCRFVRRFGGRGAKSFWFGVDVVGRAIEHFPKAGRHPIPVPHGPRVHSLSWCCVMPPTVSS